MLKLVKARMLYDSCHVIDLACNIIKSSNGCHYGVIFFKPEKNLEFFRLKNDPIDDYPGRLE